MPERSAATAPSKSERRRRIAGIAGLLVLAGTVAGCTVGPDFLRPEAPREAAYTPPERATIATRPESTQQVTLGKSISIDWWRLFQSPDLDATLQLAIEDSPTLDNARAVLAQARDVVAQSSGGYYPQLDIGADASRSKAGTSRSTLRSPGATNLFSIGPRVSYNLDIFGGTRRLVEQDTALAEVRRYQLGAAYLSLTGNVVTQALNIAVDRALIKAIEEVIAIDERNLELVQLSFSSGRVARTDVLSAQSQLAADHALMPPLRQQLSVAQDALAVLVGRPPGAWSPPDFDLDKLTLPAELPISVPSELLHRRPDILAAEAQVHASSAAIGVATAQLYPNLTLSASWSREAAVIGTLLDPASTVWQIAAGLTAPIFHGGSLSAQRQAAVDGYKADLATYQQTVLQAFGQVADILTALRNDHDLVAAQKTALDAADALLALTQDSYRSGQANILQVLDAERQYQQARQGYERATAQRLQDTAQLFAAMGGAWSDWPDATGPATDAGRKP